MFPSGTITLSASSVLLQCAENALNEQRDAMAPHFVCENAERACCISGAHGDHFRDVTSCSLVQVYRRLGVM